jgi:dTDP-glucose 4,6-dehydratase
VLEKGRPGEIYNIGGGTELSNRDLTALLLNATGRDWDSVEHVPDRKGHDRRYCLDITKASRELGYSPRIPFDEGLAETVHWYQQHRHWWEPLKERAALSR